MATKTLRFSETNQSSWKSDKNWMVTETPNRSETEIGYISYTPSMFSDIPSNAVIGQITLKGRGNTNSNAVVTYHGTIIAKFNGLTGSVGSFRNGDVEDKNIVFSPPSNIIEKLIENGLTITIYYNSEERLSKVSYIPTDLVITYTYYLDVNGQLDNGGVQGSISPMGVMDAVTSVDSRLNDTDYYNSGLEPGTTYTVNNIRANDGYFYVGEKSFSGSLSQSLTIVLPFITVYPYTINFDGNGNTNEFSAPSATSRIGDDYTIPQNPGFKKEYGVTFNFNGSGANNQTVVSSATMNGWEDWGTITASNNKQYTPEIFDAPYYANKYTDLYNAFKYNKQDLVNHWVSNGESEGRSCTGNPRGIYPFGAVASFMTDNGGTTTLKAQWSDMPAITLPSAERTLYKFLGWYTDPKNGEKIGDSGDSYIPSANITLYAHWGCTVTFDGNGATESPTESIFSSDGDTITLPKNFQKKYRVGFKQQSNGYSDFASFYSSATFLGWFTKKQDGEKVGDGGDSYTPTGNITLYAQWSEMPAITLPEPPFYGKKYVFNGYWNSFSTYKYGDIGDSYIPKDKTEVLFAKWIPKKQIYIGEKKIEKLYIGQKQIKEIYKGTTIIFYNGP